jgi:hypothetical protein
VDEKTTFLKKLKLQFGDNPQNSKNSLKKGQRMPLTSFAPSFD